MAALAIWNPFGARIKELAVPAHITGCLDQCPTDGSVGLLIIFAALAAPCLGYRQLTVVVPQVKLLFCQYVQLPGGTRPNGVLPPAPSQETVQARSYLL